MKNLLEGFKTYINEQDRKSPENRVFKVDMVLRLNKMGGVDINDVLNKIRTIPGVTVISQNENAVNYEQYYVIDTSVKFMSLGKAAIQYIKTVLVPHINSNLRAVGVPNASVRYVRWRSLKEI
tara:strand:+ start:3242 stop:3610 length:369 start_codon:yes stop_codon:yes gene_type:complete